MGKSYGQNNDIHRLLMIGWIAKSFSRSYQLLTSDLLKMCTQKLTIPSDNLWETLMLRIFYISSISTGLWTGTLPHEVWLQVILYGGESVMLRRPPLKWLAYTVMEMFKEFSYSTFLRQLGLHKWYFLGQTPSSNCCTNMYDWVIGRFCWQIMQIYVNFWLTFVSSNPPLLNMVR